MADQTPPQPEEQATETVAKDDQTQKSSKNSKQKVEDTATTIHVKLYSPYKVYFDGEAESISAENLTGPFDILPRHHNFITLLTPCEVNVKSTKIGDKRIKISRGVMHVRDNKVTIFLDV